MFSVIFLFYLINCDEDVSNCVAEDCSQSDRHPNMHDSFFVLKNGDCHQHGAQHHGNLRQKR